MKTFAERLLSAREAAGLTQVELATRAKVSPGSIGNYESGFRRNARELLSIAAALGVNAVWLKTGKGLCNPEVPTASAQQLSYADARLSSPVIAWGVLKMKTLPEAFKVAAPDDSMSPRVKMGQLVEFETGLDHRAGDGILVRDAEGELCIRRCRKVRGEWEAYAEDSVVHPAFAIGPGQGEILAILVGVHARWG